MTDNKAGTPRPVRPRQAHVVRLPTDCMLHPATTGVVESRTIMSEMLISLKGRLWNVTLPASRALAPLFEAIVNSLEAIRSAGEKNGLVKVEILRDEPQHKLNLQDGSLPPVSGFRVRDNGIGFDDANFNSFRTSDSTYKESQGGKGVGRLLWLKAFESVEVDSSYRSGSSLRRRTFSFNVANGVRETPPSESSLTKGTGTCISLLGFQEQYRQACPKGVETIAEKIAEHVLGFLLEPGSPDIEVTDCKDTASVKAAIGHDLREVGEPSKLEVAGFDFFVRHFQILTPERRTSRLHFWGHGREVTSEQLGAYIPNLKSTLRDENGRVFVWSAFISGKALDDHINQERGEFTIPEKHSPLKLEKLTIGDVRDAVLADVAKRIEPYLGPIRQQKQEMVDKFVATTNPEYRTLVRRRPEFLDQLPADATPEKLDIELRKMRFQEEQTLREKSDRFLQADRVNEKDFEELIGEANELGKSELAKYVITRRRILELFQKAIGSSAKGKYELESAVHKLIVPLRATSDDVPYDQMNLWIIDEKLAYHFYLSSDRELSKAAPLCTDSASRPDVLVFNRAMAMAESQAPFGSVVIIEFKRPARDDYAEDENPISQVLDYIEEIRQGKAKDKDGRLISIASHVPFYCYIIADLTPKLQRFANQARLTLGPEGHSFFGFNDFARAYIEVLSFQIILSDAQKRNRVFFDKLNL